MGANRPPNQNNSNGTPTNNPLTSLGDLLVGGVGGVQSRLAVGNVGNNLVVSSTGVPQWVVPPVMPANPLTTSGDILVGGVNGTQTRLAKGNNGSMLSVVSGVLQWVAAPSPYTNPLTTRGDILIGANAGLQSRLAIGSEGMVLTSVGGSPQWVAPPATKATYRTLTYSPTLTWDLSLSECAELTLTGNITALTLANPVAGVCYSLVLKQDSIGSRSLAWVGTVHWVNGETPALTSSPNTTDIMVLLYDGVKFYGILNNDFK